MTAIAAPTKYVRRPGVQRPPRASPAPSLGRSRSRSASTASGSGPRCTHCNSSNLQRDEGALVCADCGIMLEQDGNFRAEIEFDETSAGGIQTRGIQIREGQTHQRQYQNRVPGAGHIGQEGSSTFDRASGDARRKINTLADSLHVNQPEKSKAEYIFKKAYQRQFYRGRTLESVAVVSLYLSVRRARGGSKYPLMLIDFCEACQPQLNVFELGKMAKQLQSMLYLTADLGNNWKHLEDMKQGKSAAEIAAITKRQAEFSRHEDALNMQDPEDLIERFCDKLDFGDIHMAVKRDAVKVAKCMDRDWMTTGRRPAGIAGAAVIIAARMNNFRRTLREVVLVAKVTEVTLGKRIEEFKETNRSTLSVQEFRALDPRALPVNEQQKPPSAYRREPEWLEKQAAKKKKRKRRNGKLPDTATELENGAEAPTETEGETEDETENEESEQPQTKRLRVDADGFAVPELPNRPSSTPQAEAPAKRKVGKPKGAKNWKPPPPTEAELQAEKDLQEDIADQLRRNASLDPTGTIVQSEAPIEQPAPGSGVLDIYPAPIPSAELGPSVCGNEGNTTADIPMSESLEDDEFEDDPDVANCVLTESERVIKETIWVTENADWLRTEHSKKIKRELKDRELRERGIDPEKERMKKLRRKDGMLRAGRAGDIAYLEEARQKKGDKDQEGTPGADEAEGQNEEAQRQERERVSRGARDSVQVMMQQRGTFSRRVDYDKLSRAYVLPGFEDSSESRSESPDPNRFYRASVTRGAASSDRRRGLETLSKIVDRLRGDETDGSTDIDDRSPDPRSRPRSKSISKQPELLPEPDEDDEDEDAEFEQDEATPDALAQLPTPAATQSHRPLQRLSSEGPQGSPAIGAPISRSESPLSSTHTPAGYGSGAPNTPQPTQLPQINMAEDDDNDNDEDEDEDEDEDNDDEDPDDDPDVYLAAGEELMGEAEEVVDDDF